MIDKPKKEPIRVQCPFCSTEVSKGFLRSHQKRKQCVAARNAQNLRLKGYTRSDDDNLKKIWQAAGGETPSAQTSFSTAKNDGGLRFETWLPSWFVKLFTGVSTWKLYEGSPLNRDEACKAFGDLFRQARDKTTGVRDTIEATIAISGFEGLRRLAVTKKVQADKLRAKSKELLEQAAKLEAEADELDPPLSEYETTMAALERGAQERREREQASVAAEG